MSAVKNTNVAASNPPSSKKRSGGFLRQAKSRKDHPADLEPVNEDELTKKDAITPDDVLRLQKITETSASGAQCRLARRVETRVPMWVMAHFVSSPWLAVAVTRRGNLVPPYLSP
ncbi:hypothetical protein HPB47_005044 [Ixodes persulcatus]|uniref:Uncharacterized protein n=1 Tax=Ixodes persulcatus TaxID=34615 RepID=A0AC60PE05_IXOPE|nr:hypothetical protein HPB47_005044 [Ixodes persulcatus]